MLNIRQRAQRDYQFRIEMRKKHTQDGNDSRISEISSEITRSVTVNETCDYTFDVTMMVMRVNSRRKYANIKELNQQPII